MAFSSQKPSSNIVVITDGSCSPNDGTGSGGWAYIVKENGVIIRQESGREIRTTNNRMEFAAILYALRSFVLPTYLTIRTDSQYAMKSITAWARGWKTRGWRTSQGEPVKNRDLIEEILTEMDKHKVKIEWVKGHNGDEDNEKCDRLAMKARKKK